ncbi:MDR family MFS transporter [Bacillus methanolicus]|uniref:Multidrug resistance protein 3 n=1 Tax=Bacillus methanolicus (strain MGA3 / ATCC 53907) TaxID=796606 RepID=I3EBX5_BACMM|nr:DHA2 family efflux MFS transporter permease subunit [Bacillus methanolicus]AIE61674.1 Multidrug resistance protein 3 [Bacillus methanolicus MGA3]EIJ83996.1 drug resistance MFS transporter [Bacillus methanolicus MGA3]
MVDQEKNIKFIVAGLLLGILMAAMDNTIVATAMGTIVSDLGGFDKFVWVTSAYMVTTMAGMPIFGKLSDMYGRKRFFIFGLAVFLIGSALCGISQNIVQLSIYRAIQGIGGGALMPIAFTIIFDIFPPEKRGKMTGLFGAVFGTSSVLGPLLGAYITDYISWHWVFYVNVPIGLVSLFLVLRYYKESSQHQKQAIDWWGAITLVVSVVSLMFALELGGKEYDWDSIQIISLFVSFGIFFIAFFIIERIAKNPIISFWLFKKRLFAFSQILAFLYGATFIILTVFIPIFVQAVYGGSATNAGFILTPMMLGSVAGSGIGGSFLTKTSFRNLMIVSILSYFIGMYLLSTLTPDTSRTLLTIYMIIAGFGIGFSFSILPTASIHNLEPRYRGTANSTNAFLRSFGMTVGITIFGSIQSNIFIDKMKEAFKGMKGIGSQEAFGQPKMNVEDPQQLFQSGERAKIPDFILDKIVNAMSDSITYTFMVALIPIVIAAVFVFLMGNARVETTNQPVGKPEKTS